MIFPIALIFLFFSNLALGHFNVSGPRYHNVSGPQLLKRDNVTFHGNHTTNLTRVHKAVSQISDGQVQQAATTSAVSVAENGGTAISPLSLGIVAQLVVMAIL